MQQGVNRKIESLPVNQAANENKSWATFPSLGLDRPEVQVHAILGELKHIGLDVRGQCQSGAVVCNEQYICKGFSGNYPIYKVGAAACHRNGEAGQPGFGAPKCRRVLHSTVHGPNNNGHSEPVKKGWGTRRDWNRLVHNIDLICCH
jgi:hypothetical protein